MDDDYRELVRRLFAAATALIETAHEAAIAWQSEALTARAYAEAARRLEASARSLTALKLAEVFCRVFSEGPSFEDNATQGALERAAQPASSP